MHRTEDERSSPPIIDSGNQVDDSGQHCGPEENKHVGIATDESNDASIIDTVRASLPVISLYEPDPTEDQLVSDDDSNFANALRLGHHESPQIGDPDSAQPEPSGTQLKGLPALAAYQKSYANSLGNNDAKAIKLFKEFESEDKIRRIKSELLAISQGRAAEELCLRILGPVRRSKFGSYAAWAKFTLGYVNSTAR